MVITNARRGTFAAVSVVDIRNIETKNRRTRARVIYIFKFDTEDQWTYMNKYNMKILKIDCNKTNGTKFGPAWLSVVYRNTFSHNSLDRPIRHCARSVFIEKNLWKMKTSDRCRTRRELNNSSVNRKNSSVGGGDRPTGSSLPLKELYLRAVFLLLRK